jgi:sugar O-acyltransferase (sialic acid O-acetyltransferase NeuD family)
MPAGRHVDGVSVVGRFSDFDRMRITHDFIVAIGDCAKRAHWALSIINHGGKLASCIPHYSAVVAGSAEIGDGTVILPMAVVATGAKIGRYCIINKHATVGHDARLGDGVNMADYSICSNEVGDEAFLGLGAKVLPAVKVGLGATIGAGAVVTKDVPDGATMVGIPARVLTARTGADHD